VTLLAQLCGKVVSFLDLANVMVAHFLDRTEAHCSDAYHPKPLLGMEAGRLMDGICIATAFHPIPCNAILQLVEHELHTT
jgi:hypothetical protein